MANGRLRRRRTGTDIWPGFVDALSSLLLVFVFLLSIFVLGQFFLGQILSGQDEALERLNDKVSELSDLLSLEQQANAELRMTVGQLSASLRQASVRRDELLEDVEDLKVDLAAARERARIAETKSSDVKEKLAERQKALSRAETDVAMLNRQLNELRTQLASLQEALEASEKRDKEKEAIIADLGRRLNVALAAKVHELANYRSEFFGRLRKVLGDRPDIKIVGDRFVLQSELLFPTAAADLQPSGRRELDKLAATLLEIAEKIPEDLNWVLRVDGHTDVRPIQTAAYPSNWELSTARATSVVRYLIAEGVPPDRLVAAGFGEYQPIAEGNNPAAWRRNRRIEFKLTER